MGNTQGDERQGAGLGGFHPVVQRWFTSAIGTPTAAQARGWASIRAGRDTLIAAPTGSGKTLAAFLTALDDLLREAIERPLPDEVRVVYVSPLKALSADIHKNLAEPRRGICDLAREAGLADVRLTAAVRTGDTTASERAAMIRTPPHVLVTTPESLYLLLTAERSRQMLRTVRTVIVDEIHAVIGTRRGAHLALSLERLAALANGPFVRLGLSATQKPIADVARFLTGRADGCTVIDEGHRRAMDLDLEIPRSALDAVMSTDVWTEYYDRLAMLIGQHRTTLIFVNTRRLAERVTRHLTERLGDDAVTAHHGSLSKEKRLDAETRLKSGTLRALVATASLELGIDIGHVDLVCQIGSPHRIATLLQRVGRSGHTVAGSPKGRVFPVTRDDLVECAALLAAVRRGELDAIVEREAPLDVLAQQVVAEASCRECTEGELFDLIRRAWPYRNLQRHDFHAVVGMTADGFATRRGRRAALVHLDEVNGTLRGRRGARLLAQTSGGAIPDVADFRVVLDPGDTFIGTVNEDFAIESIAGDVFQLGNASWRVLQVTAGTVRVADAAGVPPNIPFWLGEAPTRSDELSQAVSALRQGVEAALQPDADAGAASSDRAEAWLMAECGIGRDAALQIADYIADGLRSLGVVPSQQTLVLERFFDEAGGMQLVLHAPFGSRVNKAWGLALRKRFCRQFNFELQAAATDDAVLLSLGPQHSFPLSDVFRYLHPETTRDVLIQAFLDAPVFPTRWRWNATIALAVPRARGSRRVPPQVQRMLSDDLMAAVFPDAAACLENIPGDRQIPDHPLVHQTVHDCLHEAMDFDGLRAALARIHAGELQLVACDTTEPSCFAHDILNAKPYAFLDDAPLEERRAHAVQTRRAGDAAAGDLGALDAAAIERVREEERPDPREAAELHDALMTAGVLTPGEMDRAGADLAAAVVRARRAAPVGLRRAAETATVWVAAERLPEVLAIHPDAAVPAGFAAPPSRAVRQWQREDALIELVRGRLTLVGPTTVARIAATLLVGDGDIDGVLLALESQGVVLRGRFEGSAAGATEWCDRTLLARIHRYTLNRLRAEIEPVSAADFMRFLFRWQHVDPTSRLTGIDGLREVTALLDGFELAAGAWERSVLPARVEGYEPSMLDMLCLAGEVAWGRISSPAAGASAPPQLSPSTPVALFLREHEDIWLARSSSSDDGLPELRPDAHEVLHLLRARGASFLADLARESGLDADALRQAIGALVACGAVRSDGFAGLRALLHAPAGPRDRRAQFAGRWTVVERGLDRLPEDGVDRPPRGAGRGSEPEARGLSLRAAEDNVETQAWTFLRRYGVVFRRLLVREPNAPPWRDLAAVFRRLEARGEIRGGRFVSGMPGEQFALPDAVARLREVRRDRPDGRLVAICTADPLNLAGVLTPGERLRPAARNLVVYKDGVPIAVREGSSEGAGPFLRELVPLDPAVAADVAVLVRVRHRPALMQA